MSFLSILARREPETATLAANDKGDDSHLIFMLAQQAVTRWRFDAAQFAEADPAAETAEKVEDTIRQIKSLAERVQPYAGFLDMAIRFEAQEILIALEVLEADLSGIVRRAQPRPAWRDAAELADALLGRRH